jgi:glycogen debranching enzyme
MDEIIRVHDQFYILATSSRVDDRNRILKHGDTFAVFDRAGNIQPIGLREQGIYHGGTRFLSRLELLMGDRRPIFLSSTVKQDHALLAVDLTNPDFQVDGTVILPRDTIHIFRHTFLWGGVCYERFRIRSYALRPVDLSLALFFEADFADIFEVRGARREHRGTMLDPVLTESGVQLSYVGLDSVLRRTRLEFSPTPSQLRPSLARFDGTIPCQGEQTVCITITCQSGQQPAQVSSFEHSLGEAERELQSIKLGEAQIATSNDQFNHWINRSVADLHMMITETPAGHYPYAGIPWFSTVFGRDGIITALEYLCFDPHVARGVLAYLASTQAREVVPERDAEPGKIVHEMRSGEMAELGEIPFGRYYGTVDATPLFIILAGAYYRRTADRAFIESIWPNIELALEWIDRYGDLDQDGFVEYLCKSPKGLKTQGWKDSFDSVFHADGSLVEAPTALCEVQGYVYAARQSAAELARLLGRFEMAHALESDAHVLRENFEERFWCEDLSTYGLALDRDKRLCQVRTSNAGHCLFSGIATQDRAQRTATTLMENDFFSGWGIRTVAAGEARYTPMSYHNGSIWPHDNALIAFGMARYGMKHFALRVLGGMFEASKFVDLHRIPELLCGFVRRPGEGPTLYPVACAPQSWSAAAVFLLLQACLGLSIDAPRSEVRFHCPMLPSFLNFVCIRKLKVGDATIDLMLKKQGRDVAVNLTNREGHIEIVTVK